MASARRNRGWRAGKKRMGMVEVGAKGKYREVGKEKGAGVEGVGVSVSKSLGVCGLYGVTSVTITFFNKAVFSVYQFKYPCVVTLVQILVCLFVLGCGGVAGWIRLPRVKWETTRMVLPLAVCWWVYVVSGIAALRFLSVPMFATLRKGTAMMVLMLEGLVLGRRGSKGVWASIAVMCVGGLVAGWNDLAYDGRGYGLVLVCCIATAMYLVMIVKVGVRARLGTFGLLFYNNVLALPLMLAWLVGVSGELDGVWGYERIAEARFWAFLLLSAAQATVLNVAIFLCTQLNSPLATTVTGQVKDFVTVGFGLWVFGDVVLNRWNLIGLGISMAGSVAYSLVKLAANRAQRRAAEKEQAMGVGKD